MEYSDFFSAQSMLLWGTFGLAFILGFVANKTNFCTMGAVSDWVNIGDKGRFRAWLLAITVALMGVILLEKMGLVNVTSSFPPYRAESLIWAENLLGGILFGIGMTLASGCGNKTLIRIGGGNLKSIMVAAIIGIIAYFMLNPLPGTDQTLFTLLFYSWIRPLAIDLGKAQDLGTLIAGPEKAVDARLWIGFLIAVALQIYIFKSVDFRKSRDNILAGVVVGLVVLGGWYLTSNITINVDDNPLTLQGYVQDWDFLAESEEGKPADSRPLAPQSFTFISPLGQTAGYSATGFDRAYLTFGVMAVLGVLIGSLLWSLLSRSFRIEWFASVKDFFNHFIGALLMGVGGVLALGCTLGQAVTGISTLALGSFIAFFGIVAGCALTMKIQYYKLVYEDEASFLDALLSSLVDLRLLPAALRRLDAV
ncbi:MAG: YeeE/YedE family protein [Gammaproteobacteria bacterium]